MDLGGTALDEPDHLLHVGGAIVGVVIEPVLFHDAEIYAVGAVEVDLVDLPLFECVDEVAVYDVIGSRKTDGENNRQQYEDDHADYDDGTSCGWFHFASRTPFGGNRESAKRAQTPDFNNMHYIIETKSENVNADKQKDASRPDENSAF